MLDYKKIGKKIRMLRWERGLSQEQLAEKVWISTTHMSHIETGSTKLSLPVLVDIAAALNASVDEILTGGNEMGPAHTNEELAAILSKCSPEQSRFLLSLLKSAKKSLDEYRA